MEEKRLCGAENRTIRLKKEETIMFIILFFFFQAGVSGCYNLMCKLTPHCLQTLYQSILSMTENFESTDG